MDTDRISQIIALFMKALVANNESASLDIKTNEGNMVISKFAHKADEFWTIRVISSLTVSLIDESKYVHVELDEFNHFISIKTPSMESLIGFYSLEWIGFHHFDADGDVIDESKYTVE